LGYSKKDPDGDWDFMVMKISTDPEIMKTARTAESRQFNHTQLQQTPIEIYRLPSGHTFGTGTGQDHVASYYGSMP
jgi:hypothetical protein